MPEKNQTHSDDRHGEKEKSHDQPELNAEDKENKLEETEEKYKRALADYQNLLKRTEKERIEFIKYANQQLIEDIIPVFDNLKSAIKHKGQDSDGWIQGLKYVVKQFRDVLSNLGVEEIPTRGKKFDPRLMEAIKGRGENIREELRPGYKLNGKVIIPAKVILDNK